FLTGKLSTQADRAGIMGAILGTFWLMVVVGPVSMFFGVGTAIYLELYLKKGKLQSIIQTNITNLAGVPSIVYGILDRKSTRLNSSHVSISYAVFCLKKKTQTLSWLSTYSLQISRD